MTTELPGNNQNGPPDWGRWFRQGEVEPVNSNSTVVMTGAENKPLLLLSHAGEGRVAQLSSDQIWLWSRGFEGGGPQAELLRRLAHWLMKEPELDENQLTAAAQEPADRHQPPRIGTVTRPGKGHGHQPGWIDPAGDIDGKRPRHRQCDRTSRRDRAI